MMNNITQFTKSNIKQLREEIDKAVQGVAEKYGITIKSGNSTFSTNEVSMKVKLNILNDSGSAITNEAENWDVYKDMTECAHLAVGDTISIGGNPYTLTGYNIRARKQPVQFKNSSGQAYKCSVKMLNIENGQKERSHG